MLFAAFRKLEKRLKRFKGAPAAAIPSLTGAFGTTGNAIVDGTATYSQTITNNNNRALEDKLNAVLVALRAQGIIVT